LWSGERWSIVDVMQWLVLLLLGTLSPAGSLLAGVSPRNFWVLCGRDGVPPPGSLELCKDCLNAQRVGDAEAMEQAMSRLGHLPVAVEMAVGTDGSRRFALPAADAPHATNDDDAASRRRLLEFSELSFGEGGHGHTTWPAGVALAIWLQRNAPFVRGQRVLELGSGVGIAGLSAALAGAAHVTLTDVAEDERWPGLSTRLQANLQKNARASQVGMVAAAAPLDWEACVAPDYVPSETYPRLLGSDLAYDERSVEALVAAVTKHLAPGGQACLVNVRNRDGPPAAASAAFVEQLQQSDEGEVVVEEAALVNNYEKTDLFILTFTKKQDA